MAAIQEGLQTDGIPILRMENAFLQLEVAPSVGGRITSLVDKATGHDFLWRNARVKLAQHAPFSEYDPNFYGGIDELIPNDLPETLPGLLHGIEFPDHGELWTASLEHVIEGDELLLSTSLPLSGLHYERRIALRPDTPHVDMHYRITNQSSEERAFLWKMHAALTIEPGDRIVCPAQSAQVVDLAWSRWDTLEPFAWPYMGHHRADVIPARDGTMDFLYLQHLAKGKMGLQCRNATLLFEYQFDTNIFPYAWLFASYGGFDGHYVAVLEPCTAMPLSVIEAEQLNQCSRLAPGAQIETTVSIYAGAMH